MHLLRLFLLVTVFCFSLGVSACAEEASGPNLWKVGDEDTTIYIFGTIHILDKDTIWTTPQLLQAMDQANTLVLEMAPEQEDPAILNPLIVRYGLFGPGQSLKTTLSEDDYARLVEVIEGMGGVGNAMDALQPWLAATVLTVQTAASHGFLPEYGVEKGLEKMARDKGIPILGLETAEFQIQTLAGLSMENQKIMMQQTLDELDHLDEIFNDMRDLWLAGDTEGLDALINEGVEEIPEYSEALLYQRNRNWVGKVDTMLNKPGTFLIAVGTGHLVGEQNLLELLEKDGLTVTLVKE